MSKDIVVVDEAKGIVRVTTMDSRWYAKPILDAENGLPRYEFVPSVTWILDSYPKGIAFYQWLAKKGWDEAQALKEAAGDKGSRVHHAVEALLQQATITFNTDQFSDSEGQASPLTYDEYRCVLSFAAWWKSEAPEFVASDVTVWNTTDGYAGTIDAILKIRGMLYLIDFKTSAHVWPTHRLQVSAYAHTEEFQAVAKQYKLPVRLGIVQLGYERNRLGYKFTEVDDQYPLFLATKTIWANEVSQQHPLQRDYPLRITLPAAECAGAPLTPTATLED